MSWDPYDPGADPGIDPGADPTALVDPTVDLDPTAGTDPTGLMDPVDPFADPFSEVGEIPDAVPSADGVPDLPNFDPAASDPSAVTGSPGEAMEVWQQHTGENGCAIGAQGMVLEYLTGERISEEQLTQEAASQGWFDGTGTAPADVGNLLELHGVPVQQIEGASLEQLETVLADGGAPIVGLDADEIWAPGHDPADENVGNLPGIPGHGANHAVWVTGIDHSDPAHPMVVLNDSGHPDGQGLAVPVDEFMGAWQDSGNFLVAAGTQRAV
ncbi:C39 family peptidase [Streptomyces sp. S.PB5]|uniref:C39 family peptidase n=1 Tax=Streptomyces sp. S.PB5 TaxID=3020844 RepID=UPI0025B209B8|nr:C39 family peptidase [Streptomyces sp. S.PB5]MDN3025885.1 C39 family peptidase [Streptomyces sp. S.PB5]